MPSGDVFAVKFKMTFAGQECRPGFYLVEGGGALGTTPTFACANHVATALGADPLVGFSAALAITGVIVTDVQPGTAATAEVSMAPGTTGDIADDNPVPPQDSMLIRWLTGKKPGKGIFAARGRSYIPGIYSTGQISGFLIADLQDALSAFASLLAAPYIADGTAYQMHAVAFNPGTPRTVKIIEPVTGFTIDNVVDIVRRRRPGRGI